VNKRAGGVAQGVGPEFKLQYCKKKKIENCLFLSKTFFVFYLIVFVLIVFTYNSEELNVSIFHILPPLFGEKLTLYWR
jgi:hypothetical protein